MNGADLGSIVAHLKLDMNEWNDNLNVAADSLQQTTEQFRGLTQGGQALQSVGKSLTAGITAPVAALGAMAIKTGSDFEAAMSNVAALSGATGKDLEDLTNTAREMGAATIFSATDAADALGYMALAGWDAQESMSGLPGVLDLAAASGMGLAEASDLVTDYLTAFGESADQATRMADVLSYAQSKSNTTTEMLGDAFKNCAVNANACGLDIEQTTAILGKMADQGLKGSEAGTALNAMFRDMTQKMEKGAIQIGKTKVKVQDANGDFRDMYDIISDVEKATKGMGDAQKQDALMKTFTSDSIRGLNTVMAAGTDQVREFDKALRDSSGTAAEQAKVKNDNLKGSVAELSSAFEELQIQIYDLSQGPIKGLVDGLTDLINWVNQLPEPIKQVVLNIALMAAVIGPLLLIIGKAMTAFAAMKNTLTMLKAVFNISNIIAKFTSAFETVQIILMYVGDFIMATVVPAFKALWGVLMANPIVLVVALVAALVAAFIWAWNNIDGFKQFWIDLWNLIVEYAQNAWNSLVEFFTVSMPAWFDSVIQWFQRLPGEILYWFLFCIDYGLLWIEQMGQTAWKAGCNFVKNVIDWLAQLPGRIWNWLVNAYNNTVKWAYDMDKKADQMAREFCLNIIDWIKGLPGRFWQWLVNTFNKVVKWAYDMDKQADKAAKDFCKNIIDGIKNLPKDMWDIGVNICKGLADGIMGGIKWVADAAMKIAERAKNDAQRKLGIQSPSRVFRDEVGRWIPEGMAMGIKINGDTAVKSLHDLSNKLVDTFTPDLQKSLSLDTKIDGTLNPNGGLLKRLDKLEQTMKDTAAIDYQQMEKAFIRGAERVDSAIYMDKTLVGEKTAEPVRQVNENVKNRLNRLEGVIENG